MNWLESKRLGVFLQIALAFFLFVLINQLANRFYFRLDLTEEKRYSITDATKNQLSSLEDQITVDVYLTGELPAGFKRVQQALLETLEEFNVYANGNISYQIVDPNAATTAQSRAEYLQAIVRKGLVPTDVFMLGNTCILFSYISVDITSYR
jgi:ABC-2 type transport system permease protein